MKKLLSLTILVAFALSPLVSSAQATFQYSESTGNLTSINQPGANSQVNTNVNTSQNGNVTGIVGNAASCSVGSLLSHAITSTITNAAGLAVNKATTVPINNPNTDAGTITSVAAHTGTVTPTGTLVGVSWDAIAFCIGNALIQYIANSTIQWINTGFNGNPAFINNPQQFFQDFADQQANQFVNQLSNGYSGIAPTLTRAVTANIVGNYNSNFFGSQPTQWSAAQTASYNGFVSGNPSSFNLNSFYTVSQNPNLNYLGANYNAQTAFNQNQAYQQNLKMQQLQWNQGYNSVTNAQGNVIVPGNNINQTAQNNLNLANLRLVAVNKFDQVVQVLVNQLIKTALNKVFTSS